MVTLTLRRMKTLPESILEHSKLLPEGGMLTPKEFLHLGSRAAVDQAFSRLAKVGLLIRAARGLYIAAKDGQRDKGTPALDKVVSSLASKTKAVIAVDGAGCAEMLGLISKAPVRNVFLTSGRSRTVKVGNVGVEIRHAPIWMLSLGSTTAGNAVRALAWLGKARVCAMLKQLRKRLSPADWQALGSVRYLLPSWMAAAIGHEMKGLQLGGI